MSVETALTYTNWAMEFMLVPPISLVTVIAIAALVRAAREQRPFETKLWKPYHWFVLTHLLFFPTAIGIGVLWNRPYPLASPGIPSPVASFASYWLVGLLYASFASCLFWIWSMKGFRVFAGALMTLIELPTLGALFVAGMSVAGDWL